MSAQHRTLYSPVAQAPQQATKEGESQIERPNLRICIPRAHSGKTIPSPGRLPVFRRIRARPNLDITIPPNFDEGRYTVARGPTHLGGTQLIPTEQELTQPRRGQANESIDHANQNGEDVQSAQSSPVGDCETCMVRSRPSTLSSPHAPLTPWSTTIADLAGGDPARMRWLERERWIELLQMSGQDGRHDYLHLYAHDPDSPIDWEAGLCSCVWRRQGRFARVPPHSMTRCERDQELSVVGDSGGESAQPSTTVRRRGEVDADNHSSRSAALLSPPVEFWDPLIGSVRLSGGIADLQRRRRRNRQGSERGPSNVLNHARTRGDVHSASSNNSLEPPADLLVEIVDNRHGATQQPASGSSYATSSKAEFSDSLEVEGPVWDLSRGVPDLRSPRYSQIYLTDSNLAGDADETRHEDSDDNDLHFTPSELGARRSNEHRLGRSNRELSSRELEAGRRSQEESELDPVLRPTIRSVASRYMRRLFSRACATMMLCVFALIADIMLLVVVTLMVRNYCDS